MGDRDRGMVAPVGAASSSAVAPPVFASLKGHDDWVTAIRTTPQDGSDTGKEIIFSTSRDKRLMVWRFDAECNIEEERGCALRALTGHSQAIQDLSLSSNAKYGLTGSWDKTVRLWDFESGTSVRTFVGHTKDVFSVAISPDNRQIVSGGRDRTMRLWNTMAECKFAFEESRHDDWVSCVRFSPSSEQTLVVSTGWDKVVKVWDLQACKLKTNLKGHTSALHTVTISPDGSLCASGGKDGVAILWDVNQGIHLSSLPPVGSINALCFSPCHYWLCAATDDSIKIWDVTTKKIVVDIRRPAPGPATVKRPARAPAIPWITSLAWSTDGEILFAGKASGEITAYKIPAPTGGDDGEGR